MQDNAKVMLSTFHHAIRRSRLVKGETMRDQRLDIQAPTRQHLQHGFEISLRRPANVRKWIVLAPFFEGRIVPSRAVGARNLKRQLFLVEIVSREFHSRYARQHNPPSFSRHECCLMYGLIAARSRSN